MHATITLDDQLYRAAQEAAAERHVDVDEFIVDAIRRAVDPPARIVYKNGLPVMKAAPGARVITSEDVRRAEDEP